VVQEAYVNGVSTRKVDRLVQQLGIGSMSKSAVSRLCARLDEQVTAFRERPLDGGAYPYLGLDAKIERVREVGGVRQKCLVIAYAVHESGRLEVVGLDVGECETEAFWGDFLRSLTARGLSGVRLCVSDAHEGLRRAIGKVLACQWQSAGQEVSHDSVAHVGHLDREHDDPAGRIVWVSCRCSNLHSSRMSSMSPAARASSAFA
jgi:putative transposase